MRLRKPLIRYTREIHTGSNRWSYESTGLLSRRWWILCNGDRVDARELLLFPAPYLASHDAVRAVVYRMKQREIGALLLTTHRDMTEGAE